MSDAFHVTTLFDVADVNPQSLSASTSGDTRFFYIDLGAVSKGRIEWDAVMPTTFASAPSRARRVTRGGDALFGTVRPALESHAAIPLDARDGEFIVSTGFAVLRARPRLSDPHFLAHYCFSESVRDDARRAEVGSNYPAVNESDIKRFMFPSIPVDEQRRIAEILDTLDDQIHATEEIIAKLERVRRATLEDLLSGASDPMKTRKLMSVTSKIVDGVHHTPTYVDTGVPFITVENLTRGPGISLTPCRFVSRRAHNEYRKRIEPLPGDVLVSKDGTLGVARLVPDVFPAASVFVSVAVLRPMTSVLRADFLRLFFDTNEFQRQLRILSAGSGLQHIHLEHFREFLIPDLTIPVQESITSSIAIFDERLTVEQSILGKLNLLRTGLMSDLLTGRVRLPLVEVPS